MKFGVKPEFQGEDKKDLPYALLRQVFYFFQTIRREKVKMNDCLMTVTLL